VKIETQVKKFMDRDGLNQRQLSLKAGVTQATVSKWLNNHLLIIDVEVLYKFAQVFECNPKDLLEFSDD